jgi:hypothetical protein
LYPLEFPDVPDQESSTLLTPDSSPASTDSLELDNSAAPQLDPSAVVPQTKADVPLDDVLPLRSRSGRLLKKPSRFED